MDIEKKSILSYTGQAWKYHTGLFIGLLSTIVFVISFFYPQWKFLLIMAAGAGAISSLIIEFTIRCPKCKSRWYLEELRKPIGSGSVIMVRKQNACPACGLSSDIHT